jgi:hypothetical protein
VRGLRRLRETTLLRVVHEDRRAVLVAAVAELPIDDGRIDVDPEDVEQLLVRDLLRVVDDLDGLGVAGVVVGDLLVGRVDDATAGVAGRHADDADLLLVRRLHAPEAAAGERRFREAGGSGRRRLGRDAERGEREQHADERHRSGGEGNDRAQHSHSEIPR